MDPIAILTLAISLLERGSSIFALFRELKDYEDRGEEIPAALLQKAIAMRRQAEKLLDETP